MTEIPCVYEIRNKKTGGIYVGSTNDYFRRMREHFEGLRNGTHRNIHLQRSFKKHGEISFEKMIIEKTPVEKLIEREQYWIAELKDAGVTLYNLELTLWPEHKLAIETCKKISAGKRKRYSTGWNPLKGVKRPDWVKEKISKTKKEKFASGATKSHWIGKKQSPEHIAKKIESRIRNKVPRRIETTQKIVATQARYRLLKKQGLLCQI